MSKAEKRCYFGLKGFGESVVKEQRGLLRLRAWVEPPALAPGRFQLQVNWTGRGLRQAALRPISDSPVECRATRITDSQIEGLK